MKDIIAIKDFMEYCNIVEGKVLSAIVVVNNNGQTVYQGKTNVYFSYDAGYMQYRVTVDWKFENSKMHDLGLHGSYNTNFQEFQFANHILIIKDDNINISISKE